MYGSGTSPRSAGIWRLATSTGFFRRLRAIVTIETEGLDTLPGKRWLAIGLTIAAVLLFSGLRLGIKDVYTESLPFLIVALAVGLLSRTTGLLLVACHAIFELLWFLARVTHDVLIGPVPGVKQHLAEGAFGRLISLFLLWVLVVTIPFLQRWVEAVLVIALRKRLGLRAIVARLLGAFVAAGTVVALVYTWGQAAAYLIRPVFLPDSPPLAPIQPLQNSALALGLAGAMLSVVLSLLYRPRAGRVADIVPLTPVGEGVSGLALRVLRGLLVIALLSGIISGPLDVILLSSGLVGGELAVAALRFNSRYVAILGSIAFHYRAGAAFAVTLGIAWLVTAVAYHPIGATGAFNRSEFFPLVIAITLGLLVFRILLEPSSSRKAPNPPKPRGQALVATVALGAAGVALLLQPGPAMADNCGGLQDCAAVATAAVVGAIAGIAAYAFNVFMARFDPTPPGLSELSAFASEEGAERSRDVIDTLKELGARNELTRDDDDAYDAYQRRSPKNQNPGPK